MKATLLLADAAEAAGGKLYLLGGGWTHIGPAPAPMAIAGIIEVAWTEANQPHRVRFELLTEDGQPVTVSTPGGERPVQIDVTLEVGRPPGTRPGSPFNVPVALNLGPLALASGRRYVWRCSINDVPHEEASLSFSTRDTPAPGATP